MCSCIISDTHSYIMAFFFHTVLFLFFVCILEGTEEEKMETDTDSQQPEKVKSL